MPDVDEVAGQQVCDLRDDLVVGLDLVDALGEVEPAVCSNSARPFEELHPRAHANNTAGEDTMKHSLDRTARLEPRARGKPDKACTSWSMEPSSNRMAATMSPKETSEWLATNSAVQLSNSPPHKDTNVDGCLLKLSAPCEMGTADESLTLEVKAENNGTTCDRSFKSESTNIVNCWCTESASWSLSLLPVFTGFGKRSAYAWTLLDLAGAGKGAMATTATVASGTDDDEGRATMLQRSGTAQAEKAASAMPEPNRLRIVKVTSW